MNNISSLSEPHHAGAKKSTTHWAAQRVTGGNTGEAPNKPVGSDYDHSLFLDGAQEPETPLYHALQSLPLDRARGTSLQNHGWAFLLLFHSSTGHWAHELIQLLTSLDVTSHGMAFSLSPLPSPSPRLTDGELKRFRGSVRGHEVGPGLDASSQVSS